ncbi:MAG: adenylosuccinate lyase [Paludibacteraceae bacterium]|nr:adenylosuccinate lyase [Paludibacteraceae bacterium]
MLTSISPIDGRYASKTAPYTKYFSEYALIRYRVQVEIEYFIALCQIPLPQLSNLQNFDFEKLRNIYHNFSEADACRIKDIESITNHDVKAVEYFLKEQFEILGLGNEKEFIHFGLTSQDINNTSIPMSLNEALEDVYFTELEAVIKAIEERAILWENVPMLARTHGQPASPTRLGKELMVFVSRLKAQYKVLKQAKVTGKFGGATGNFNAHHIAYPTIDWRTFANDFLETKLNLQREAYTTQISNYDSLAEVFDALKRINVILIDLCRDIWQYVSMEFFKQRIKEGEVGSSAMPHKVNPIDFENAEGNLGVANAVFEHLALKLPISRLQRDLTDSTVLRNIGVPMAHTLIATQSLLKGLGKLQLNEQAIYTELDNCWAVVAEGIQTVLRREGYPKPYEALKALTRTNKPIDEETISSFIDTLNVSDKVKCELRKITPHSYTGI